MKVYVAGLLFSEDLSRVVLVKKKYPPWQAGKYNAVGGKVEEGETFQEAMSREFKEEAGVKITNWRHSLTLVGFDWIVYFFATVGDITKVKTTGAEHIFIASVNQLPDYLVDHIEWIIPFCRRQDIEPVTFSVK